MKNRLAGFLCLLAFTRPAVCGTAVVHATDATGEASVPLSLDRIPAMLAARGALEPPAAGVSDLKFGDMLRMPIGPRGPEPNERLLDLNRKTVRMTGYMVRQNIAIPGVLVLTPMPLTLGVDDDPQADVLPANAMFVHLPSKILPPYLPGPIRVIGTLDIGPQREVDGKMSSYRLTLDDAFDQALVAAAHAGAVKPPSSGLPLTDRRWP